MRYVVDVSCRRVFGSMDLRRLQLRRRLPRPLAARLSRHAARSAAIRAPPFPAERERPPSLHRTLERDVTGLRSTVVGPAAGTAIAAPTRHPPGRRHPPHLSATVRALLPTPPQPATPHRP